MQPFADAEVAGVVDGGLGAKGDSFLVVLLHVGVLVFDVQGRDDAVGEDPGPEPARGDGTAVQMRRSKISDTRSGRPKSRLSRITSSKNTRPDRGGPGLGEGELGLQDREVIAVAGPAVRGGERVREPGQPFAHEPVDLGRVEPVADPLEPLGSSQEANPLSSGVEADPGLGGLAFGPLVAVQAHLGVVGKVGAELDEERPEVLVDGVHVEVVHDR